MKKFLISVALVAMFAVVANAADDWGTVKGKFTYDGTPPKAAKGHERKSCILWEAESGRRGSRCEF